MLLGRWAVVALGVAIPLSTALDNLLLIILLVVLLGNYQANARSFFGTELLSETIERLK